jgi:predicted dehydrogenase
VKELNVGVIGYGYTGKLHTAAYLGQTGVQLSGIADTDPARLTDLPSGVSGFERYEELLDSGVDAVSVCLPTYLHLPVVLDALSRGKHVLVEKPIAATLDDAVQMLRAAKTAGRTLYVGMTHRFYPELQAAKALIDSGAIGEIVAANDCILEHFGFLNVPGWYLKKQYAGGGAALTSGIHLVDRLRWFLGDEVQAVTGSAGNPYFGGDVDDRGQMHLVFHSGVSAQITMALMREPHPLVCDLQIIGTLGSLTVHTWQGYEIWNQAGHRTEVVYTNEPHPTKVLVGIKGEIGEFCASIAAGRTPWPSAEESTRALKVIMGFYESSATRRTVAVGELDAI